MYRKQETRENEQQTVLHLLWDIFHPFLRQRSVALPEKLTIFCPLSLGSFWPPGGANLWRLLVASLALHLELGASSARIPKARASSRQPAGKVEPSLEQEVRETICDAERVLFVCLAARATINQMVIHTHWLLLSQKQAPLARLYLPPFLSPLTFSRSLLLPPFCQLHFSTSRQPAPTLRSNSSCLGAHSSSPL